MQQLWSYHNTALLSQHLGVISKSRSIRSLRPSMHVNVHSQIITYFLCVLYQCFVVHGRICRDVYLTLLRNFFTDVLANIPIVTSLLHLSQLYLAGGLFLWRFAQQLDAVRKGGSSDTFPTTRAASQQKTCWNSHKETVSNLLEAGKIRHLIRWIQAYRPSGHLWNHSIRCKKGIPLPWDNLCAYNIHI